MTRPAPLPPFAINDLGDAIMRWLEVAFADFRLNTWAPEPAPGKEFDQVTFYLAELPPRGRDAHNAETGPVFPLVLVHLPEGGDEAGDGGARHSFVTVVFEIGQRKLGPEGRRDVIAIIERLRRLCCSPLIEKGARLELPLTWELGVWGDTSPQWTGTVTAKFCIPQPVSNEVEI